ncbi:sensor histidine kinase [Brachybacterium sp. AOP43-C2-M15]|uniref:sensor histidine kinase n=1 Tax=Brachybacterium sp. AOP43-C2-M15 TaxID=3457661 RepID=UPI004034E602
MTSAPLLPTRRAPWVMDAVLAVAVAVVLAVVVTISQAAEGLPASPLALVFVAGFGAVLLLRRRLPVAVLVLSALGTFAYYTLDLPTIGVALPVVAALFSAAEQGRLRWAIGVGAVVVAVAMAFRVRDDPQPLGILLGTDAMTNLALSAAGIALGHAVRSHRLRSAQQAQIARLQEQQGRREAELRLRDERERISRELHDTVGHSLSVISLHSGVAADAVGHDDAAATEALARVRDQARQSLAELRAMVRLLRTEDGRAADERDGGGADGAHGEADGAAESARHVRSLADLPALLDPARAAGLRVAEHVEVAPGDLSSAVDGAAYRIVQESVTNVLRHARATTLEVTAGIEDGRLHVLVADDGGGADLRAPSAGVGLLGMQERARLLGGTLALRSTPGEGFTVEAELPARLDRDGAPPRRPRSHAHDRPELDSFAPRSPELDRFEPDSPAPEHPHPDGRSLP